MRILKFIGSSVAFFYFALAVLCFMSLPASSAEPVAADSSFALASLLALLPEWLQAVSLLVTAAAGVAALTPTPKDDGVLLVLRKIIDFLALNIGGAKNASSVKDNRYLK